MSEEIRACKKFTKEDIVVEKLEKRTPSETKFYYFSFLKSGAGRLHSSGKLGEVAEKIEKAASEEEAISKEFKAFLSVLSAEQFPQDLSLRPIGYAAIELFPLRKISKYNSIISSYAQKMSMQPTDIIALITSYFPLYFVSEAHKRRGVGSKVMEIILKDLQSCNVKFIYCLDPSAELEEMIVKKFSFNKIGSTDFFCRKL